MKLYRTIKPFVILFVLFILNGCGNFSTEQSVFDCNYEAVKQSATKAVQYEYIYACMKAKGYELNNELKCHKSMSDTSLCWEKTWSILLL